jgi:hypothetical protein
MSDVQGLATGRIPCAAASGACRRASAFISVLEEIEVLEICNGSV